MILRLAASGIAVLALLAAASGGSAGAPQLRAGLRGGLDVGLDAWPDWGRELELSDLRHALDLHPPAAVERWLFNPRERTARGLERLDTAGPGEALALFEAAGRLAPDDRRVLSNLGTARLLADHGDAVAALERAVDPTLEEPPLPPEAQQRAYYSLGTARLAAGDAAGAVAALEEALRREPSHDEAKFNLELALRLLEEARLPLRPPREAPGGKRPGEEAPTPETGGTEPEAEPEGDDDGGRDPGGSGTRAGSRPDPGAAFAHGPVAGFEEQGDLTAAQAAALLEAVETLERQQRRVVAGRAAREAGAEEEDW